MYVYIKNAIPFVWSHYKIVLLSILFRYIYHLRILFVECVNIFGVYFGMLSRADYNLLTDLTYFYHYC